MEGSVNVALIVRGTHLIGHKIGYEVKGNYNIRGPMPVSYTHLDVYKRQHR